MAFAGKYKCTSNEMKKYTVFLIKLKASWCLACCLKKPGLKVWLALGHELMYFKLHVLQCIYFICCIDNLAPIFVANPRDRTIFHKFE